MTGVKLKNELFIKGEKDILFEAESLVVESESKDIVQKHIYYRANTSTSILSPLQQQQPLKSMLVKFTPSFMTLSPSTSIAFSVANIFTKWFCDVYLPPLLVYLSPPSITILPLNTCTQANLAGISPFHQETLSSPLSSPVSIISPKREKGLLFEDHEYYHCSNNSNSNYRIVILFHLLFIFSYLVNVTNCFTFPRIIPPLLTHHNNNPVQTISVITLLRNDYNHSKRNNKQQLFYEELWLYELGERSTPPEATTFQEWELVNKAISYEITSENIRSTTRYNQVMIWCYPLGVLSIFIGLLMISFSISGIGRGTRATFEACWKDMFIFKYLSMVEGIVIGVDDFFVLPWSWMKGVTAAVKIWFHERMRK